MKYIYDILSAVLGIGLVFFILNGAINNVRYKRRGIINLCVGFLLSAAFVVAFIFDYKEGEHWLTYYNYYLFILMPLVYGIILAYYFMLHMRGRPLIMSKKNISKYYFTDYLYVIYRYENDICLEQKNEKYRGIVCKIKGGEFHETCIHNLNRKFDIKGRIEIDKIGKVTYKTERKTYHCYQIRLSEPQAIKRLQAVNAYQLVNMPMGDFDKEILFRLIVGERFDIDK
ncbi:MAG TPA: hypothetical protein VIK96_03605 [Bacilli bacterium]